MHPHVIISYYSYIFIPYLLKRRERKRLKRKGITSSFAFIDLFILTMTCFLTEISKFVINIFCKYSIPHWKFLIIFAKFVYRFLEIFYMKMRKFMQHFKFISAIFLYINDHVTYFIEVYKQLYKITSKEGRKGFLFLKILFCEILLL